MKEGVKEEVEEEESEIGCKGGGGRGRGVKEVGSWKKEIEMREEGAGKVGGG